MGWLSTLKGGDRRRRKKAKKARLAKHLKKYPKYYNHDNEIPWRSFCLVFTFYMLFVLINSDDSDNSDISTK